MSSLLTARLPKNKVYLDSSGVLMLGFLVDQVKWTTIMFYVQDTVQ